MKVRNILFSGEMIRALLDGRKTMTRRVIKDIETLPNGMITPKAGYSPRKPENHIYYCPYGQPGDLLWVREGFRSTMVKGHEKEGPMLYRADYPDESHPPGLYGRPWKPSIHMPRWASRLTLEITDVRVERVQDISEKDAWSEGAPSVEGEYPSNNDASWEFARDWFADLWDSINNKPGKAWADNPWVWVILFNVHQMNVDEYLKQVA